jgi:PAS domain S-box-containing protein
MWRVFFPSGTAPEMDGACIDEDEDMHNHLPVRRSIRPDVRSVIDNALGFMGVIGPSGELLEANQLALRRGGVTRKEVIGRPVWETKWWSHDKVVAARLRASVMRALSGQKVRYETTMAQENGEPVELDLLLSPVMDPEGEVLYVVASAIDISPQKLIESQRRMFIAEVTHRSRNLLGLVLNIADATLAKFPPEARQDFHDRIDRLIAAQDLMQLDPAKDIRFSEVLESQIAPIADQADGRIHKSGPDFLLRAEQAQTLGMILYELATNAIKHGALSQPNGRIYLDWEIVPDVGVDRLDMIWSEEGLPIVDAPRSAGYGSFVLTDLARVRLGAVASIEFGPKGLIWTMQCPLGGDAPRLLFNPRPPKVAKRRATDRTEALTLSPNTAEAGRARTEDTVAPEVARLTVLLAEDDPIQAFVMRRVIEGAGMAVIGPVAVVADGLAILDQGPIDVAVVDYQLADTDSTALLEALVARGVTVVILSGRDRDMLREKFPRCQVLRKPIRPDRLVDMLQAAILAG